VKNGTAGTGRCPNVEVMAFSGLLMEFLQQQNARIILRGLRQFPILNTISDGGDEPQHVSDVETMFMTPSEQYMFVSATIVREIALLGGDADKFVHPLVAVQLRSKARE